MFKSSQPHRCSAVLFVTNLPAGVATAQLEAVFAPDPGFQQLRTVRQMIFVDFYDIPTATASMRLHQNHFFEGFPAEQGIMIDYDKDPRHKRNRAFTGQSERGAYTHGLGHEIGGGGGGGRVTGQYGSGPMVPAAPPPKPPPRDATLDLINKIKADYSKRMGIEVPLYGNMDEVVDCPADKLGRVIGRGGSTIRDLEERSGCTIKVNQSRFHSQVKISGVPEAVTVAKQMVLAVIDGGDGPQRVIAGADSKAAAVGIEVPVPMKPAGLGVAGLGAAPKLVRKPRALAGAKAKKAKASEGEDKISGAPGPASEAVPMAEAPAPGASIGDGTPPDERQASPSGLGLVSYSSSDEEADLHLDIPDTCIREVAFNLSGDQAEAKRALS
eukprot:CAMPEP_0172608964 /NCGR_PEP_ID=MMETSP1068-20121228/29003_1 /TAXON_ID=35684 /ORGANISM="Pseudopedinella elastica, Strain CCMP716" /LENGTH=383 /DNA_ID=CAMNT_0013412375 /DNA_START=86 /DNA_END=1239 /DNA_ORIENTATION=-